MLEARRPWNLLLGISVLSVCLASGPGAIAAAAARPIAVTVEGLPLAPRAFYPSARKRERITRDLLEVLKRHGIRAVALVRAGRVEDAWDEALLRLWLDDGHELGNHSFSYLDYTRVPAAEFIADVEQGREALLPLVRPSGRSVRYFRFPGLREGETLDKLDAARSYLSTSRQTNLPVTIDDSGEAFEREWVETSRTDPDAALTRLGDDYVAAVRLETERVERTTDILFDRAVPQILSLHAGAIDAASWDELFLWLESTGHRFVPVEEVLLDPAFDSEPDYVGEAGYALWDRVAALRRERVSRDEIRELLELQIAAWNRGDLEEFCSVYADDALFISPSGTNRGRRAILDRYRKRYPDRKAMGTLGFEIVEIDVVSGPERSVTGGVRPGEIHGATVAARWSLSYSDRDTASGLTLIVMRARGGRWVIVQDASM